MLPNQTRETPWWAWVVAILVILVSVLILPEHTPYIEQLAHLSH